MEVLENKKSEKDAKSFSSSQVTLINRENLAISGVERVYETNENKIQLKVAGSNLLINGQNLNIARLDVESGNVNIEGKVNELKYFTRDNKSGFLKKIFK